VIAIPMPEFGARWSWQMGEYDGIGRGARAGSAVRDADHGVRRGRGRTMAELKETEAAEAIS